MSRHRLTLRERVRGIEKAVKSPYTPDQLRPGLRVYLRHLRKKLRARRVVKHL
jgi:hypothetical protein